MTTAENMNNFGENISDEDKGNKNSDNIKVAVYLNEDERIRIYLAICGLLDSGCTLENAFEIFLSEYETLKEASPVLSFKNKRIVNAVNVFSRGLKKVNTREEVSNLVNQSFGGSSFITPEERMVLSTIKTASDHSLLFKTLVQILKA